MTDLTDEQCDEIADRVVDRRVDLPYYRPLIRAGFAAGRASAAIPREMELITMPPEYSAVLRLVNRLILTVRANTQGVLPYADVESAETAVVVAVRELHEQWQNAEKSAAVLRKDITALLLEQRAAPTSPAAREPANTAICQPDEPAESSICQPAAREEPGVVEALRELVAAIAAQENDRDDDWAPLFARMERYRNALEAARAALSLAAQGEKR